MQGPVRGALVTVRLFGVNREVVWSVSERTSATGLFRFATSSFPVQELSASSYSASVTTSADGFATDTASVVLRRSDSLTILSVPSRVMVSLPRLDRTLNVFLLFPAFLGIVLALLSLAIARIRLKGKIYRYGEYNPAIYAIVVAFSWVFAIAMLVWRFVTTGQSVISLGMGDATIPSALIVSAFLGSLTYIAYSIYTKQAEFFEEDNASARKEMLLVVGGRLLVAPYVAIVAFGILAPTFPQLQTPPFVLFFGFFTGLWIKAVLDNLNEIGKRLLSDEARAKVVQRALEAEKEVRPPVTGGLLRVEGQQYQLDAAGGSLSLTVDRSRIALGFENPAQDGPIVASALGLGVIDNADHDGFVVFTSNVSTVSDYSGLVARAGVHRLVRQISPVFGSGDGQYSFATRTLLVGLVDVAAELPPAVSQALSRWKGTAVKATAKRFIATLPLGADPFTVSAALNQLREVALAEPDLVHVGGPSGDFGPKPCPSGGPVADLGYRQALVEGGWREAQGADLSLIKVAVLDDGVDLEHPDLKPAIAGHFDCFQDEFPNQFPLSFDHHGTGCAGLAAARPATDGMKGVGFGAQLLAIRVNHKLSAGGDLVTSNLRILRGIEWAVEHGADVLNLSWSTSPSLAVQEAIEQAARTGRNGKGCVVVAACGNNGGPVAFPARLACVIAVAATNATRILKRPPGWSSSFGPETDLAAPGTDSFTTIPEKKYGCLDGSSAATAIVSGAVAAVLGVHPEFTAKGVRDHLIATSELLPAGPVAPGSKIKFLRVENAVREAK